MNPHNLPLREWWQIAVSYCGNGPLGDAVLWTAAAYFEIAVMLLIAFFVVLALKERGLFKVFGKTVTAAGIKKMLKYWPILAMFGGFILSCSAEHLEHWRFEHGYASSATVNVLMLIEAAISCATAVVITWILARAVTRLCRT